MTEEQQIDDPVAAAVKQMHARVLDAVTDCYTATQEAQKNYVKALTDASQLYAAALMSGSIAGTPADDLAENAGHAATNETGSPETEDGATPGCARASDCNPGHATSD